MRESLFEDELIPYFPADASALLAAIQEACSLNSASSASVVRAPSPPSSEPDDLKNDAWFIGISKRFKKSVANTDRNRQGRIFEAVMSLAEAPMEVVGDTVKPLSDDKKGYWRRRCGDYRLTYKPDPVARLITLVDFEPRGSAYA